MKLERYILGSVGASERIMLSQRTKCSGEDRTATCEGDEEVQIRPQE